MAAFNVFLRKLSPLRWIRRHLVLKSRPLHNPAIVKMEKGVVVCVLVYGLSGEEVQSVRDSLEKSGLQGVLIAPTGLFEMKRYLESLSAREFDLMLDVSKGLPVFSREWVLHNVRVSLKVGNVSRQQWNQWSDGALALSDCPYDVFMEGADIDQMLGYLKIISK